MYYKKDEYYITDRDEYNITKYNTKGNTQLRI